MGRAGDRTEAAIRWYPLWEAYYAVVLVTVGSMVLTSDDAGVVGRWTGVIDEDVLAQVTFTVT